MRLSVSFLAVVALALTLGCSDDVTDPTATPPVTPTAEPTPAVHEIEVRLSLITLTVEAPPGPSGVIPAECAAIVPAGSYGPGMRMTVRDGSENVIATAEAESIGVVHRLNNAGQPVLTCVLGFAATVPEVDFYAFDIDGWPEEIPVMSRGELDSLAWAVESEHYNRNVILQYEAR